MKKIVALIPLFAVVLMASSFISCKGNAGKAINKIVGKSGKKAAGAALDVAVGVMSKEETSNPYGTKQMTYDDDEYYVDYDDEGDYYIEDYEEDDYPYYTD